MEFFKNLFKDDDRIIGLSGFKKEDDEKLGIFIPKFNPAMPIYNLNYRKNFFLT